MLDYYLPVWTADGVEARERAGLKDERPPLADDDRRGRLDTEPDPDAN